MRNTVAVGRSDDDLDVVTIDPGVQHRDSGSLVGFALLVHSSGDLVQFTSFIAPYLKSHRHGR